ncbi:CDP-diacylglycerol--glycerol-3-phosphate 3-phosphatidyltransferase [Aureibacillus halotolerans]|uniref:CDP-diacylglycerol--glycerol-3-phosphate 3-phosphatidyltransferase n=1 Tax=Aureibacillus halotolerans TaxID=1508390 RepID=A0A4R6U170_9BACI|nr:CDP-diacylglycerol--glycerol-3-phosphate 3-phosphatidyltransferase [Aureibacillus halotolerans]TDQ39711.1 CDP-diacylglycerol--glycerol-3-phosphate 3-phosphatidyltransferase [Aureibacillus halotolerans]
MNLPNKITVGRIFLIPVFMVFMLVPLPFGAVEIGEITFPIAHMIGAFIFVFASLTDWVDGYLARKHNLVTNFGKFMDPLADKLLVSAALLILIEMGDVPAWIAIVIISREFAVTGLRLIAAADGTVLAASQLAKFKTWTQMIAIVAFLLYNLPFALFNFPFATIALWVCLFFTVISGWDYFVKNKEVVLSSK